VCLGVGSVVRMMSSVLIGEEDRDGLRAVMKTALSKGMILAVVVAVVSAILSGPLTSFLLCRQEHPFLLDCGDRLRGKN
ncbi:MAG: hypothetical protein IJS84_07570, partial [Spirochaetales bacterium]|nr:hypothetical protein [Spirochaetales bacterium]